MSAAESSAVPRRAVGAPAFVSAALGALIAGASAALALPNRGTLAGAMFVVQVVLVLGWLHLLAAPANRFGLLLGAGSALAGDLLLVRHAPAVLGSLAGVIAIGLVVAIAFQLAWRSRIRVTDVVSAHTSAVLLVAAVSCFIAVRGGHRGRDAAVAGLLALAAGAVAGRMVALAVPRPALVPGRGAFGLLAWAAAGAAVGAAVLGTDGAWLGAATGFAGGLAEAGVVGLPSGRRGLVVAAVLPIAAGGPVTYLLGRVLLG